MDYSPILLMLVICTLLAIGLLAASNYIGPKKYSRSKLDPYECGMPPKGDTLGTFSIKYYLVGALFILFDVEIIFLFAWAVIFKDLGILAFVEIIVFLLIILAGYLYILRKGALKWD
ncbi:MAG: NADH-quinone oxidoreductase subunit A [Candidatus Methanosuratincola sp.]|jgi:NADH-quinone oxidoreductase subunit A